jgi:hypothetical protein
MDGVFFCASGSAATPSEPVEWGEVRSPGRQNAGETFMLHTARLPRRIVVPLGQRGRIVSRPFSHRRRSAVCRLERLEDRTVLSSLLVTSGADSGLGSLRDTIAAAPSGSIIEFANKVHSITLATGELAIAKNLDIEGPGANKLTISGNDASRIFDISAGKTVTIAGITITHGLADGNAPVIHSIGGGILNEGDVTLSADVLSSNQAVGATNDTIEINTMDLTGVAGGGGVANLGTLAVSNSTFAANQAHAASGSSNVGLDSFPGGAFSGGLLNGGEMATATVTDCQFTSNLAQGGNGCDGSNSPAAIPGSAAGGAIANFGFGTFSSPGFATLIVSGSNFSNNQAVGGNDGQSADFPGTAIGGAIASHRLSKFGGSTSLDISDCAFDHNEAIGGNHNVVLEGNPAANLADHAVGGAIFAFPTGTITHCAFDYNQVIGGQGLAVTGPDIDPGTVDGGLAAGGAIDFTFPWNDVTVSDCTFDHNSAIGGQAGAGGTGGDGSGGAVEMGAPNTLTITGCIIDHNQAQGGSADTSGLASNGGPAEGGGLDNAGGATIMIASTVDHNQAIGAPGSKGGNGGHGWGGGIANELGGTLSIICTTVDHNKAQGGEGRNGGDGLGGGLYNDADSTLTVTGATVQYNFAVGGSGRSGDSDGRGIGGGAYLLGTFTIDSTTVIKKNHASTSSDNIGP